MTTAETEVTAELKLSHLSRVPHTPATDDEIENYARGVVTGVMLRATPNVVATLLSRIRADAVEIRGLKQHIANLVAEEA